MKRLGIKIKVNISFDIDDSAKDHKIPILSIQPIVHNAVIHGILPSQKDGEIEVVIRENTETIDITIIDNGVGISEANIKMYLTLTLGKGVVLVFPM